MCEIHSGVGYYVRCPGCGAVFHETTDKFTESRPASGAMFQLIPKFGPRGANWSSFPNDESQRFDSLTCPGCGCSYTQGGSFVRVVSKKEYDTIEDEDLDHGLSDEYRTMIDSGILSPPDWNPDASVILQNRDSIIKD